MRIAIVTDIHEDFEMLEKAFAQIRTIGYDLFVCLGDITGYAPKYYNHQPNANACIDLLRAHAGIVLAGNHDLFSSKKLPSYHLERNIPHNWYDLSLEQRYAHSKNLWLYEEEILPNLSTQNQEYLNGLKEWCTVDSGTRKILLSHYFQPDLTGVGRWFPYRIGELRPHFKFMNECGSTLSFVGHCHPDGFTLVSKLFWSMPSFEKAKIKQKPRIVLCPPIVSRVRKSSFIIFDSLKNEVVPYNI
jgi:predicted phosphodiesterase